MDILVTHLSLQTNTKDELVSLSFESNVTSESVNYNKLRIDCSINLISQPEYDFKMCLMILCLK